MCLRIWWGCHRLPVTKTTDSCLVANLSGNLVGHSLAHLPWDIPAGLSGDLERHLPGNLAALLHGNAVAFLFGDIVALLLWHAVALLLGDAVALLLGNVVADLLGHAVAHLLRNIIAYGLRNGSGSVNALGLRDLGAPWAGNQAGLLDWPLVADTLDLSLTPWGTSEDGTSKMWLGISLTLAKMSESPHSSQSMDTSKGRSTSNGSTSKRTTSNGTSNNRLNGNIVLNSNQSSPGLSTVLRGDVCALVNKGRINNWVRFSDTVLTSGCGTLLVGHLLDNISADLLRLSVADLLRFGVAHFFIHSVANLFGHGVTNLLIDSVTDLLIDSVANLLVTGVANVVVLSLVLGFGDSVAHPVGDSSALLGGGHIKDGFADGLGH
jgi:hypothetical protein